MKKIIISLFTLACVLFVGCSDDETLIEVENVAGISLKGVENSLISLLEFDDYKVEVVLHPENAQNVNEFTQFIFTSSDESVFTVDAEGNIKAVGVGEALLTVKANNKPEISVKCMVKVSLKVFPVESIEVSDLVTKSIHYSGVNIDLGSLITILPEEATFKNVKYTTSDATVATVTEEGIVQSLKEGRVTITIEAVDDSGVSKEVVFDFVSEDKEVEFTPQDRTGWKVTASHDYVADNGILGTPEALLDGKPGTGLSLKKSYYGKEPIFFTVETEGVEFNSFRLVHRKFYAYIAVQAVDILGSNDGVKFDVICRNVPVSYTVNSSADVTKTRMILPEGETAKYKFIRVEYSTLDMSGGQNAQVMEIDFGLGTYK